LPAGDIVAFPVGEEGGHQLWNRGESTGRFLSISSSPSEGEDIVFYSDSGKVGVYAVPAPPPVIDNLDRNLGHIVPLG
jgi:uncharacterized cupin superfamily protein